MNRLVKQAHRGLAETRGAASQTPSASLISVNTQFSRATTLDIGLVVVFAQRDIEERSAMPTYEYVCKECGHQFELVERMSEHATAHKCPKCGSEKVEPRVAQFFAKTSRKS